MPWSDPAGVIVWAEVYGEKCCSNLRVLMQTLVPSRVKGKITVLESGECVAEDPRYTMEQISVSQTVQLESEVKIRFLLFRNIDNLIIHSTPPPSSHQPWTIPNPQPTSKKPIILNIIRWWLDVGKI